jgi:hypothetical protein
MLGENGRGEKVFFLHLPMATKHGTFHWPPNLEHSIGHQAWNLPLATKLGTFHWPPSFGSTFISLLLLFKRWTWIIGGSLALEEFSRNLEYLFSTSFLKRQIMISLSRGKKEGK